MKKILGHTKKKAAGFLRKQAARMMSKNELPDKEQGSGIFEKKSSEKGVKK